MEPMENLKRCCFTGHRPEKLNISGDEVKIRLKKAILQAIEDGFTVFISGMARGVDMWAAEIVLEIRETNKDIKLMCVSPFKGFEKSWKAEERLKYMNIINQADYVKFVFERYSRMCFQIRNRFMVDNSERVIAAYNGESGGTRNTVLYAMDNDVETVNILI